LERILRDELDKYSCSVELGSELVSLTDDDDLVEAVMRKMSDSGSALDILDVPFVVGADGQNSTSNNCQMVTTFIKIKLLDHAGITREQLEIKPLDGARDEEYIIADVKLEGLRGDVSVC
jgi:2-polyprenyl-6-methoxyphenol hydroxylase-like FAD-dependent oxidoreductase